MSSYWTNAVVIYKTSVFVYKSIGFGVAAYQYYKMSQPFLADLGTPNFAIPLIEMILPKKSTEKEDFELIEHDY